MIVRDYETQRLDPVCPNSSRTNASEFGGRPRNSCGHVSVAPCRTQTIGPRLERLIFLSAAARPKDRLAVFGATRGVEWVGLEDGGVHVGCEDEGVRVTTMGQSFVNHRDARTMLKGIAHP